MKKVFALFLFFLLLLSVSSAENVSSVRILCTDYNYSAFQDYAAAGHDVNFRNGSINDIATALASRDPDIDVFVFQTRSGLDQLKKQPRKKQKQGEKQRGGGPLTDASDLMDKLGDLYPAFQNALMDNGNLVGWYVDAQPWGWQVLSPDLLEELALSAPTTFDELLDVSKVLFDSGLLSRDYVLMLEYRYTQQDMLTFYLRQFLIASERVDGQINFLRPEFARIAEKIRNTVPETSKENLFADYEVFTSSAASVTPSTYIELIPSVLDDAPSGLYYLTVVAVINPYSNNIDGAIDLMHYLATYESATSFLWDASLNQPVIRSDYDELVARYQGEIARLEAKENRTTQDESDLDYARSGLDYITEHPYSVSPEDIAYNQNLVQYAYIPGDSPVTFDDALKTLMQRYLNGAFDAEGFARACQEHVNTVYLEMGLTPMYVPN